MASNGGAPFGAPAQPAFGQPSQPAQPAGQAPAAGKITFGAAARVNKPPGLDSTAAPFGGAGFGATTGFGSLAGPSSNAVGGHAFGSIASGSNPFGNSALGNNAFGSNVVGGGNGLASQQGFGAAAAAFGAKPSSEAQPKASNPFARLGNPEGTPSVAGNSASPFQGQGFGAAPSGFGIKSTDTASQPGLLGKAGDTAPAFGAANTGSNPFANAANNQSRGLVFGQAAKSSAPQHEPQAQNHSQDQQQRATSATGLQAQQVKQQAAKQKQKAQSPAPNGELVDPAALAARNARFGAKQAQGSNQAAGPSAANSASPAIQLRLGTSPAGLKPKQTHASQIPLDAKTTDDVQAGEQPLQRPPFLGGMPFTPTSAQPLPAGLDTDDGPGDEMLPEVSVEGFCSNMCPDYQLQSRTANANENSLEVIDPLGQGRGIGQLATKKFERNVNMSDNEALPNMFRTLPALNATEKHLMDYLDSNDPRLGLGRVSMYIWDRQRSIRQDMAWQKMEGLDVMRMYEEHAMTAIYMDAEMSHHGDPGGENAESYHPGLVIEQLNKTLISLTAMYEAAKLKGQSAPNAAEFNTYAFIMLLVGTRQKDAATHFFQRHILPYSPSPYVALALKLHRLVSSELNPYAFFKLVSRAPYRLGLWLHFLFPYVRYLYLSRLVSTSGIQTQAFPVSQLAQAIWSDGEEDALDYLRKAGLEPGQLKNGAWQLVLSRGLKLDPQAASFKQRSERLCQQQNPVRSQNVLEQGRQAEAAVQTLLTAGGVRPVPSPVQPTAATSASPEQNVPATPVSQPKQDNAHPVFAWLQSPQQAGASPSAAAQSPTFGFPSQLAPDPSTAQKPVQASQASLQQLEQQHRQHQEAQKQHALRQQQQQQQQQQQRETEQRRIEEQQQQQEARRQREAEERAHAEQARLQEQQRQQQLHQQQLAHQQRQDEQRRQQQQLQQQRKMEQQEEQQRQIEQQRQEQHRQHQVRQHALARQQAAEHQRQQRDLQAQQDRERHMEHQVTCFRKAHLQKGCLQHWHGFTAERKVQYGHHAIYARLAATSPQRPASVDLAVLATSPVQAVSFPLVQPPAPGQDPLHLPSLIAPALAANNEGQTHLRWKVVIHHMPATAATATSPDFAAAKWLRHQMAYKSKHSSTASDGLLSLAYTDLTAVTSQGLKPVQGIFTAIQAIDALPSQQPAEHLAKALGGVSALVMLITRADDPQQTEAQFAALLKAAPPGLHFPLLLVTTAPDLHQGVQKWAAGMSDKLPAFRQHVSSCKAVSLAGGRADKADGCYSASVLQEALRWAAAQSAPQLPVKAIPLERLLADELEQHLEPLETNSQVGPDGWIGIFNQMLLSLWQRLNEAAGKAADLGGWPPAEIARIDATLPQLWWQASALAAFEGALSSMCLPGMPASLGASPQEAVPIYVRHFLSGRASGGSWRRSLASAMHARIRAVQQQGLPPAVLLPSLSLPPLFPQLGPPCRLPSALTPASGPLAMLQQAAQPEQSVHTANGIESVPNGLSLSSHTRAEATGLLNEKPWQTPVSQGQTHGAWQGQPSQASYAAALQSSNGTAAQPSGMPGGSGQPLKANKRKVTDVDAMFEQSIGPVKRSLNEPHPDLTSLEEQTAKLQTLMEQSTSHE